MRPLIVIPALDEESSVGEVVAGCLAAGHAHVLVVDDGSRDGTATRARAAGADVVSLPFNLGVGGAMRTGFRYALLHGFDAVVQVDGDGQHDPAAVGEILDALGGADVVVGARFAGKGHYEVRGPRLWAMRLLARAVSRRAGVRLTDVTSGFRGTGPRALALFAEHYPAQYLGDTVESLLLALEGGLVVTQVPVAMRPRETGAPSQRPLRAAVHLARAVLVLILARIRQPVVWTHAEMTGER